MGPIALYYALSTIAHTLAGASGQGRADYAAGFPRFKVSARAQRPHSRWHTS